MAPDPLAAFDYTLPPDRIASRPPPERDGGRLLDLTGENACDRQVVDLPSLLSPGDLLVVNNTRVVPARVRAQRASGGRVEVFFLTHTGAEVEAMLRPARRLKQGERLIVLDRDGEPCRDVWVQVGRRSHGGAFSVVAHPDAQTVMARAGAMPIPPYLKRDADHDDDHRYQTIFAGPAGAVAAPTAGLHLTERILGQLDELGVKQAVVTLHVGAGTFRDLRPEDLERGELHAERYHVPQATSDAIAECKARGGRVVAVGTTATRTLESAARARWTDGGSLAGEGTTRLFLKPGDPFMVVDLLWTNLHLPRSSLLMLVCAFGGRDRVMAAYARAVERGYRFFSYGDAMIVGPQPVRGGG